MKDVVVFEITEAQIKNINNGHLSKFAADLVVFYESQVRAEGMKIIKINHLVDTDSKAEAILFHREKL